MELISFTHIRILERTFAIMASHSLAIAKASLAASMMKPDPHPVPKAEISTFYGALEMVSVYCSSKNIQV